MARKKPQRPVQKKIDWSQIPFTKITVSLCFGLFAYVISQMRFDSVKSADKRRKAEESRRSEYIRCEQRLSKEIARKELRERKK